MINIFRGKGVLLIVIIGAVLAAILGYFLDDSHQKPLKKSETSNIHKIEVHFYDGKIDTISAKGNYELDWVYGDWCLEDEETVLARGVQYINVIK
jgi:hypothetical protein